MRIIANYNQERLRDTIDTEKDLLDMRNIITRALAKRENVKLLHENQFTVAASHDYLNMADEYFHLIKSDGSEDCEEL